MRKNPSRKTWIIVHILFPLLPFIVEGFLRFGVLNFNFSKLTLETFSAVTLSMSLGLLALFINQCLITNIRPLTDDEELQSLHGTATIYLIISILCFALFATLVILSALSLNTSETLIVKAYKTFQKVTFVASIIPISLALSTQKTYKLKASI